MKGYAVARLTGVVAGADILDYLQKIDATLRPFGGRFIIHGGPFERLEGQWEGDLVVIEFPDRRHALDWYQSRDYQAIVRLRLDNATTEAIVIDGVADGHKATDVLAAAPAVTEP